MKTRELDYDFDPSLVATAPASPRDAARLMVVDRTRGAIDHRLVRDLPSILRAGDHLFVNETSVLRARTELMFQEAILSRRVTLVPLMGRDG